MARQLLDSLSFCNEMYSIAGVNGTGLFTASDLGVTPDGCAEALTRGYLCSYRCDDDELRLGSLFVHTSATELPLIAGKAPRALENQPFVTHKYENLDLPCEFTGGLLAVREFVPGELQKFGSPDYPSPFEFQHVLELLFSQGHLATHKSLSEVVARVRKRSKKVSRTGHGGTGTDRPSSAEEQLRKQLGEEYAYLLAYLPRPPTPAN